MVIMVDICNLFGLVRLLGGGRVRGRGRGNDEVGRCVGRWWGVGRLMLGLGGCSGWSSCGGF